MEDIYNREKWYKSELKRVRKANISDRNKEIIIKFHNHLYSESASDPRVVKLSCQLRKLAIWLEKDFDKTTEEDIRKVVAEINKSTYSEATKSDYKRIIKQFYKWFEGKGKTIPEKVEWIKCRVKTNGKDNMDIITPSEVKKVIEQCENTRDKAFLSLLYEGGFRIAEILNMKIRDFENSTNYGKARVTGKTGPRKILVVSSVAYINQHLSTHPFRENPDSFLWLSIGTYNHNQRLNYIGSRGIIKRAFKRAEVKKKRLYPHLFRHSRATELASHLTEAQMKKYFGWEQGSDMASVYVHMSGRDVDNGILNYYGLIKEKDDNKDKLGNNINCQRCNTVNPSESKYCTTCGLALNIKVAMESEALVKEETNKTFELLIEMMNDPKIMKEFNDFKENHLQK
ncbi:MAG: site-specific integrase [archaeon]